MKSKTIIPAKMVKRNLAIPVSLIKTQNPRNLNKFKKQLNGIIRTPTMKLMKNNLPSSFTEIPIRKGVLCEIRDPKLSGGKVNLTLVDSVEAVAWVVNGIQTDSDFVRITKGNKATPAHLPDLSDLALQPKVFKVFIAWFIAKFGGLHGPGTEKIIPKSIRSVIDPTSELPPVMELCWLSKGEHSIVLQSYRNDFKIFNVEAPMYATELSVQCSTNSSNILDGRSALLTVDVTEPEIMDFRFTNTKFFVWNCRDMARETFFPSLSTAIDLHMPDVVVLTETRVSVNMARLILHPLMPYRVCGVARSPTLGGTIIITFRKELLLTRLIASNNTSFKWALIHLA